MMQFSCGTIISCCKAFYCLMWTIFFWSGTEWFQKNIIDHMRKKLAISKEEIQACRYLGLNIAQKKTEICIHQKEYIAEIECIKVDTSSQKEHKLLPQETQQ